MKTIICLAGLAIVCGCAHFTTKQTEVRNDQTTTITTKASAFTFWESKSSLANFKARQSASSQEASVGSLMQESGGTNTAATVHAVVELLKVIK